MKRALFLACALACFGGSKAFAADGDTVHCVRPEQAKPYGAINFVAENDMFNGTNDRNYTNGLQLTLQLPFKLSACVQEMFDHLTRAEGPQGWAASLSITNLIFTPENLTIDPPDPHDRPYAGVTALTLSALAHDDDSVDEVGVSLGLVGPNSGSSDLQSWWHKSVLHIGEPAGWDTQLPNSALAELTYQHTQRTLTPPDGVSADLSWSYGFGVGTFQDYAQIGIGARAGLNIGDDFGPPRIAPSLHGSGFWHPDPDLPYFGGFVFVGTGERFVAYDQTIDARRGPDTLKHREWINDTQWGWVLHVGGARFSGVYIWRDRQFRTQREPDSFGVYSVTISACWTCYNPWRNGVLRPLVRSR